MVLKQAAIEDSGLLSQIPDSRSYYYEASYAVNLIYSLYNYKQNHVWLFY